MEEYFGKLKKVPLYTRYPGLYIAPKGKPLPGKESPAEVVSLPEPEVDSEAVSKVQAYVQKKRCKK